MSDYAYGEDYDPSDDYDCEPDDYEPELRETSHDTKFELERKNGQLIITRVDIYGNRYSGQDWGEAEFWDETRTYPIDDCKPEFQLAYWQFGKRLKEGQSTEVSRYWLSDFIGCLSRVTGIDLS